MATKGPTHISEDQDLPQQSIKMGKGDEILGTTITKIINFCFSVFFLLYEEPRKSNSKLFCLGQPRNL